MAIRDQIPAYALYGESNELPDLMHVESIHARASLHDWRIAPHRHAALSQFFVLMNGGVRVEIDGEASAPDLPVVLFVPRRMVHGFTFARRTEGYVITLPDHAFPEVFERHEPLAARLSAFRAIPATEAMTALTLELADQYKDRGPLREPMLRGLALTFASAVAKACALPERSPKRAPSNHFNAFQDLVHKHLHARKSVAAYASELAITPQQLNRIVRSESGMTASAYIDAQTFQEAKRLLAYTRLTSAEVGYRLGFHDPAYFSRAFRRSTGQSPSDYRNGLDRS